jgi:integrase
MMIVAADMGLRADEIRRITWADITDHGLKVTNQKNNNQKDLIPFTVEARQALVSQPKRSMFVFTTESGSQLSPRNMKRDVRARMRQIGIPDSVRPFQDLRGTFTTLLIQSGVDIKTTQMLARHSNAKTTINSYLRTSDQAKSEAIDLMQKRKGVVNEGSEKDSISKSG